MTIDEVEKLVTQTFADAFGVAFPGFPVDYDASKFETEGLPEYARFSMNFEAGQLVELSGTQFRRFGTLFVQIFVPSTEGKSRARVVADPTMAIFEGQSIGPVRFRRVGVTDVGVEDAWYQSNVVASFEYDQFR